MNTEFTLELKSSIETIHKQVEELSPFFNPNSTLNDYTDYSAKFEKFYQPLQNKIQNTAGLNEVLNDLGERKRKFYFLSDEDSKNTESFSIPQALAVLYIFEGSTLGGQYINQQLKKKFQDSVDARLLNSLNPYQEKVGVLWQNFKKSLDQHVSKNPDHKEEIKHHANQIFSDFYSFLKNKN